MSRARVQINFESATAGPKAGAYMQGIKFPYVTKRGFPVILRDGDDAITDSEEVFAPAGLIGLGLDNQLYVVDINGDPWPMGLTLPGALQPQPLEIDDDHPFFKAAQRSRERAETPEETPAA